MIDEPRSVVGVQAAIPDAIRIHDRVRAVETRAETRTCGHSCGRSSPEQLVLHRG